jgi:hypothetical protein
MRAAWSRNPYPFGRRRNGDANAGGATLPWTRSTCILDVANLNKDLTVFPLSLLGPAL